MVSRGLSWCGHGQLQSDTEHAQAGGWWHSTGGAHSIRRAVLSICISHRLLVCSVEKASPGCSYMMEGSAPIWDSIAGHAVADASMFGLPGVLQWAELHLMA